MNVSQLQRTDRWLGIPLCLALTLLRFVASWFRVRPAGPLRTILFVKLAEQGSTVLAHGALCRAVELVGRGNVYFIAFGENRFILDALGVIPAENVVTLSCDSFLRLASSAVAALIRLRRLKLDAAVDMEFFSRGSAALTYLSGARRRVGFHAFFGAGPYRGNLMTHRLLYNPYLHTSQVFQTLVEALLQDPAALPALALRRSDRVDDLPRFAPETGELHKIEDTVKRELQRRAGAQSLACLPPLILLNPNASDLLPVRRWPTQRYVELAKRLLSKYQEPAVIFTGAPNEANAAASLVAQAGSKRAISLAGQTTLRELLVLYCLADVLVTNDSGPVHFAMLTPLHVVTLFGPETPALYAARSPRNTVLYAGLACSPCVNAYNNRQTPCRNNLCLQEISVDEVFAAVCAAYERSRDRVSSVLCDVSRPQQAQDSAHRSPLAAGHSETKTSTGVA